MDKKQFLKLKKNIDLLLKKAIEEAVNKGVDISSPEFEEALLMLKTKLIKKRGITLEEYDQIIEEINAEKKQKKDEEKNKISDILNKVSAIKGEKGDSPIKGKDYFTNEEIEQFKNDVFNKVKIPPPKIIKEITKETPISQQIDRIIERVDKD